MQNRREVTQSILHHLNDPGYRLPGENPANATLNDARRWADTYDQLVGFKRELLGLCQRFLEQQGDSEVARAIRETDLILLETQASRFEQKRDYWRIRATELDGNGRRRGSN